MRRTIIFFIKLVVPIIAGVSFAAEVAANNARMGMSVIGSSYILYPLMFVGYIFGWRLLLRAIGISVDAGATYGLFNIIYGGTGGGSLIVMLFGFVLVLALGWIYGIVQMVKEGLVLLSLRSGE